MRTSINPFTYFVLSPIYIINFGLCCYFMYGAGLKNFAYLTSWTLLMNSTYLLINLIADTFFFFSKKSTLEFLHIFSREKIAPVVNSFTYMVFISFWGMASMGSSVMKFPLDFASILKNIYQHGLITVFVMLDVFLYEHKKSKFELINIALLFIIFILYGTSAAISIYEFDFFPYPFMEGASFPRLCIYGGILFLFVILGYFIHIGLNKLKYKLTKENDDIITDGFDTKGLVVNEV